MGKIDMLMEKAKRLKDPPMSRWERAMMSNPYVGRRLDDLIDLLAAPCDDWRLIVQACVWKGGG